MILCSGAQIAKTNAEEKDGAAASELFYDFDKFKGLTQDIPDTGNRGNSTSSGMDSLVTSIITLLKHKCPISDDLLILALEYSKTSKNDKLLNQLCQALSQVLQQCLDKQYQCPETKSFDYFWFKEYLLNSNIWLCSIGKKSITNSSSSINDDDDSKEEQKQQRQTPSHHKLLYHTIARNVVTEALVKQKEFIWESVENESKTNKDIWNGILNFNPKLKSNTSLRQDTITNGIESQVKNEDIYPSVPLMDNNSNFDVFNEYDTKVYLTKCLVFAHRMNPKFQQDAQEFFNQYSKGQSKQFSGFFQAAPVKLYQRCVVKSQTDYSLNRFPRCAHILDLLRCAMIFDTANDMLTALNLFGKCFGNGNNKNRSSIIDIVRVKNGFKNILNWKNMNDSEYCDIKFNVIVKDEINNECQVAEVQFLLDWLLKAKKIGHKLYGVVRNEEYIINVNDLIDNDLDYGKYKSKIMSLVKNKNVNHFGKEMMLRPNYLLSIIHNEMEDEESYSGDFGIRPILYYTSNSVNHSLKMFDYCLASIFHFGIDILGTIANNDKLASTTSKTADNEKENTLNTVSSLDPNTSVNTTQAAPGDEFLTKYFNFKDNKSTMFQQMFWGLDTRGMRYDKRKCATIYKLIDTIMKSNYFKGMSEKSVKQSIVTQSIIYYCCHSRAYDYLQLLLKYHEKNVNIFKISVPYGIYGLGETTYPLEILISGKTWGEESRLEAGYPPDKYTFDQWLDLVLFHVFRKTKIKFKAKRIAEAYYQCVTEKEKYDWLVNQRKSKFQKLFYQYAKETEQLKQVNEKLAKMSEKIQLVDPDVSS